MSYSFQWNMNYVNILVSRFQILIAKAIIRNEDVQFLWSILSADWEDNTATALLQMVISEWVKIRGFSYASCWIEKYKSTQRKTLQKSKGVRKQLLANPNSIKKAKTNISCAQDNSHSRLSVPIVELCKMRP